MTFWQIYYLVQTHYSILLIIFKCHFSDNNNFIFKKIWFSYKGINYLHNRIWQAKWPNAGIKGPQFFQKLPNYLIDTSVFIQKVKFVQIS